MTLRESDRVTSTSTFFIVGPTAVGKSELAADVAARTNAEIVSADAFQIYREFSLLTARPDCETLAKVPHHLVGEIGIDEEMNVERFRVMATTQIGGIHARGKRALVVGGTGLYVKALTHGLSPLPQSDPELRRQLNEISLDELVARLTAVDPAATSQVDLKNPRRVIRALEIALVTGQPASVGRKTWSVEDSRNSTATRGVLVERDREELKSRINRRVEEMFEAGVIEEVRRVGSKAGATAAKTLGFKPIGELLEGKMTREECIRAIQAATRQYAKRQLTWFRHQSNFEPLNLSLLNHADAVDRVAERVLSLS
jgi:tRNA dimethylallyltransferase